MICRSLASGLVTVLHSVHSRHCLYSYIAHRAITRMFSSLGHYSHFVAQGHYSHFYSTWAVTRILLHMGHYSTVSRAGPLLECFSSLGHYSIISPTWAITRIFLHMGHYSMVAHVGQVTL